ncbi:MAG: fibronectin type III domain-containing protein, partial [Candidatus Thermoplasmatota archaeon]|nr:fibronectin type III domain-containing protein [Candidatus Thermoplasmatota archaeon]
SYRIMANDGIYWRMTRTYEVVVIDITPPSEVLNFIAQPIPGIADVGITWVPATDNVGINRYVLQRSLDGTNWSALANVSGSATSFQDSSTNPETLYHYRIWAEDEARNAGVKSYSSTATDDAQPPRITHSPESMFDEGTAIHLQANIIDSSPIAAHLWYESGASNQTLPLLLSNDTWQTSIPAIHVVVGTIRYRISATDGLFWSNTPEYEIMVLDVTPPTAVPGFTATPEDGAANITLDWLPAWDNVRVEKYVLIRSTDGQNWTQLAELDRDIRSYNDAGLEENTTYHYSILAVDARNNNGLEAYVEATTWTAPPEQPIDDDGTGTVNETTPPRPLGLMDIALFMPIPILLLLLLLLLVRKRPKPREEKKEMEEESIERENSHPEETENASGEAGTSKN